MGRTNTTRVALVIAATLCLVGLVGIVGSWGAYLLDSSIVESGSRASALVTRKYVVASSDGDSDFMLVYEFSTESGQSVQADRGVPEVLWDQVSEGQTIEVAYASGNPERSFPLGAGAVSVGVTLFVSGVSLVLALFGAVLLWSCFRDPSRAGARP
jgi:hypothetical protein